MFLLKIKLINETQHFGNNGFRKRELVIITDEQYPQHILIEFIQDKCDLLNDYKIDQEVKINIVIKGRERKSPNGEIKYFNSIQGWKIALVNSQENIEPQQEKDLSWLNDNNNAPTPF